MSFANALNFDSFPAPYGSMMMYAGNTMPNRWLKCDGTLIPKGGAYLRLYESIGDTYFVQTTGSLQIYGTNVFAFVGVTAGRIRVGQALVLAIVGPPITRIVATYNANTLSGTFTLTVGPAQPCNFASVIDPNSFQLPDMVGLYTKGSATSTNSILPPFTSPLTVNYPLLVANEIPAFPLITDTQTAVGQNDPSSFTNNDTANAFPGSGVTQTENQSMPDLISAGNFVYNFNINVEYYEPAQMPVVATASLDAPITVDDLALVWIIYSGVGV